LKSGWGSISDIDEERYTWFMQHAVVHALPHLKTLERAARSNPEGQPCTKDRIDTIRTEWWSFVASMAIARTLGEKGTAPPLTGMNLHNLKEWTGVDISPAKVLRLYRGKYEVVEKGKRKRIVCLCCGTTPLSKILPRLPVRWSNPQEVQRKTKEYFKQFGGK